MTPSDRILESGTNKIVELESAEPLGDYIILRLLNDSGVQQLSNGILVFGDRRVDVAQVVAVGVGRQIAPRVWVKCEAQPGDYVLVAKMIGEKIRLNGEDCLVVKCNDPLARVKIKETSIEVTKPDRIL